MAVSLPGAGWVGSVTAESAIGRKRSGEGRGRRNVNEEKCWRALTLEARATVAALLTTAQTFRRPYCDRQIT